MKRFLKALAGGTVLCVLLSLCGFDGQCQSVRDNVVRLHILANSDSAEDQTLKLKVRDAVTAAADGWFDGANGETEALTQIEKCLPALRKIAQETVYRNGYAYPVQVQRCRMYFETRQYGDVTMPAGMYEAVRFVIGEGKGKNWWCVIYPPLCIRSAVNEKALSDVLDDRQMSLVTGEKGVSVRFKVVEIFWWIVDKFR